MVVPGGGKSHGEFVNSAIAGHAIAVVAVIVVWLVRLLAEPVLGGSSPLLPFAFAVTIAAYFGGVGPGILAAILSTAAGGYFMRSAPASAAHVVSLIIFVLVSTAIIGIFERLRREHARASDNEERFRLLVEGASLTSIFALDREGRIESWNAGAERLMGYAAPSVIGSHIDMFYRVEDRDAGAARLSLGAAVEHGSATWTGWLVRSSAELFWAEVSSTALRAPGGALRGFSQVTRDLTESKRHETALSDSEQTMRAMMESAAQGIVGVNRDGQIFLVNAMAEQLFGYSREEMLGRPVEVLLPSRVAEKHVGQRDSYFAAPRNRPMGMGLPLSARRKNGTEFPVEISLSSVQTRQGQLAISFITDISSRQAAEQERENLTREIAAERARLRAVLDQMPVGVILADAPGPRIILHNREAERLLGHDVTGPSSAHPFGAEDEHGRRFEPSEYPLFRAFNTGQTIKQEEMHYRRGDGAMTVLSVSAAPIRDSSGEVVAAVTTFTDISQRKQAEVEREELMREMRSLNVFLERSNEDLRQFAYAASHDLQEPLRMVTSYTQLLERRYGTALNEDGRQFIDYAVTGARRIENLLKALREYWQVSEVGVREPVWTDCNAVLERALQHLQGAIRESGAIVTRDSLPTVLADETPLLQLFQNLISNALKYRHPDRCPAVHIRATAEGGEWIFSITDNGIGIDPQYASQVFGIFKRLNGYRYSGAGMGLAICQKIVERFGGRIWVKSKLGEGATFMFTIPTDQRRLPVGHTHGQATSPAPSAGSQR